MLHNIPFCIRTFPWLNKNPADLVRRRAADAGIETAIGCHTFRATGITDYLTNGGRIEVAQRMAGHSNAKTTGLYDRRNDDVSVGEVERIGI
jgi:integrase/recombinase XerD